VSVNLQNTNGFTWSVRTGEKWSRGPFFPEKALALDLPPNKKSMIFLYLKMDEEAIRYLKNSSKQIKQSKRSMYLYLKNHPIYDFLRPDPRFQEIVIKHKKVYDENLRICEAIDG
jgi:hypothetical protein